MTLPRHLLQIQFILLFKLICVSCAKNSSLTFVIDDTRSMYDDIEQVRLAASDIMDLVTREKASEIKEVVLVTFNDPEVRIRTKTTEKQALLVALEKITPRNYFNDDCPEYSLSGIIKALEESSQGSYIYVFTDASAKDYTRINEVISLCEKKQSQVVFLLTGDCRNPDSDKYNYKVYDKIALACKGQVFSVNKDDLKDIINTIKETAKGHKTVVESKIVRATYNPVPVPFTVDDKTEYVIVSTSGRQVELIVTDGRGHVMETEPIFWKSDGKVVKFDAPAPGTYQAWVKGMTDISVMVYARTDFSFDHGFSEFVPNSLTDASKQPIKDRKHHLSISVSDPEHSVAITSAEILDMQGRVLATLPLTKTEGDFYITNIFISPSSMFDIQVTGTNKKTGNTIKRLSKTHIEPQNTPKPVPKIPEVSITEGTSLDVEFGGRVFLTCIVSAYPPPKITWTTQGGTVLIAKSYEVEPPYKFISYLNLTDVKYSGSYSCKASNFQSPLGKSAEINIKIASPFTQLPSLPGTKYAKYGEGQTLTCDISSKFPLYIKWKTPRKQSDYTISRDRKVLTIKSVGIDDEGTYTCEAMLASDPTQKNVVSTKLVINDLEKPSLIKTIPTNLQASDGEQIKILCKLAAGVPRPTVTWQVMRNGDNVFRDMVMTGEELSINTAGLADAGQYRCLAQNVKGQDTLTTHVTVNKIPVIELVEGATRLVPYGSTNELTCKIVGHPLPKVEWKDSRGTTLKSTEKINKNEIISMLKLHVVRNDAISCFAGNSQGTVHSTVDLQVISPITVSNKHTDILPPQFEKPTDVYCDAKSSFPMKIMWFYKKDSQSTETEIRTSEKYTISPDRTKLRIMSTNLDTIGLYKCQAYLSDDPNQSMELTTKVELDLSLPELPKDDPKTITVNYDNMVKILCRIVGGIPPPTVSWQFKRKGDKAFRNLSISGQELTLQRVSLSDAGRYRCIAKNAKGQVEKDTELVIQKPPTAIVDDETTVNIPYGSNKQLTCKSIAFPQPSIVWKDSKGNMLLSQDTVVNDEIVSYLQVQNIKSSDTFTCYAANDLGTITATVTVNVLSPIKVGTTLPDFLPPQFEKPTDVYCDAKSSFPMKIMWFYKKDSQSTETEIRTSEKYAISPDGTKLRIMSTNLDTIGLYKCQAYLSDDPNQSMELTTKVELDLSLPELPKDDPKTITVKTSNMVKIPCRFVGGIPPPTVSWQFKRKSDKEFRDLSVTGQELTLQRVSLSDAGHYRCIAKNAKGQVEKDTELVIHKPPTVVVNDETTVDIPYGSNKQLTCKSIAFPQPSIVWKDSKGNKLLSQDTVVNDEIISHLQVQNIKTSDTFTCYAANDLGTITATVTVNVLSPIKFGTTLPEKTNGKYGEPIHINCNVNSLVPINIVWFYQKEENSEKSQIYPSDKYTLSADKKTLNIMSPDLDLVGKYTCIASVANDEKVWDSQSTDVAFTDLSGPEITEDNETATVMNGQKMTTKCTVTGGKPSPTVSWQFKRKGDQVFRDISVTGQELTLQRVSLSDAGHYRCIVKNAIGQIDKTTELIVKIAPSANIDDGAVVDIPYGSNRELKCRSVAFPLPSIVWKDSKGNKLSSQDTVVDNEIVSHLLVQNAKTSDTFTCQASNDLDTITASITVNVLSPITFGTTLPGKTNVKYGKPAHINCDIHSLFPMNIEWFYQKQGSSEKYQILPSNKFTLSADKKTLNIISPDLDLVGKYTCIASVANDGEVKNSQSTDVALTDLNHPQITETDENITVLNGQLMNLICTATGIPKPVVTWYFKPRYADKFDVMPVQGYNISNPRANYRAAGTYMCIASNGVGNASRTIDIDVHGKPKITNSKSEYDGVTGDKVLKIPCDVIGGPEPTITWKHGGKPVTPDARITISKNAIIITNPTENDTTSYTCEAQNKYGLASKHFGVVISDFVDPAHVEKDPNSVYLKSGESATIKCRIPHSNSHSVRWYVNSVDMQTVGSTYSIRDAQFSNDGNYTCRVNTDQGSESLNTLVDIGYKPTFLSVPSSFSLNIDWNYNKESDLDCFVNAKPKESNQWYYNGKLLNNTSPLLPVKGWGQYVCKVGNPHGTIERTFKVTSSVCTINRKVDKLQSTPLLLGKTPGTWAKFDDIDNSFVIINRHQTLNLACSTLNTPTNTFKRNPNLRRIKAQCDREDRFIVDGKTYKFNELQCKESVSPTKILSRRRCASHGKITEVGFQLDDGFLKLYDVCIEDEKTVYTKTLMSDTNIGNTISESLNINPGIKTGNKIGKIRKCHFNLQPLVSPVDVAYGPAQITTLKDSSISVKVYEPCEDSFRVTWSKIEGIVQNVLHYDSPFNVWSGASHYNSQGVPRYLWKAAKFEDDSFESIVFVNDPEPDSSDILCSELTNSSTERILGELDEYSDVYTYACTSQEFTKQFKILPTDFGLKA